MNEAFYPLLPKRERVNPDNDYGIERGKINLYPH